MLIDKLGLPYTNVFCDLDKLNGYHTQLWALPKLHTYTQQETSFLHVDSDVFIWEKFDDKLLRGASQYLSVLVAINEFNLVAAAINDLLMVCKYSAQSK